MLQKLAVEAEMKKNVTPGSSPFSDVFWPSIQARNSLALAALHAAREGGEMQLGLQLSI